jgi:uncharacterized protein (DUF983 family)
MSAVKQPEVTAKVAFGMIWRALRLRCPHCGSKGIFRNWFNLMDRCPRCGLHLHREEGDYFLGAYMILLMVTEALFAVLFVIVLLITWPNPPWTAIEWVGVVVLFAGILVVYPFAKTVWLAVDLVFRPVSSVELRWYGDRPDDDEDSRR